MKLMIDIPADDFNAIYHGGLFDIRHDRLDEVVTYAFNSATIIPKGTGDLIDFDALKGELWWVSDCPHIKLNEQALEIWRTIEKAPTVIKADRENEE